jgi:hypothetical protein
MFSGFLQVLPYRIQAPTYLPGNVEQLLRVIGIENLQRANPPDAVFLADEFGLAWEIPNGGGTDRQGLEDNGRFGAAQVLDVNVPKRDVAYLKRFLASDDLG